ncbi:hypothetical protein D3C80_1845110 [compost metagenome]
MKIRRGVVNQSLDQGEDDRVVDVVEVIDHEVLLGTVAVERVDQCRTDRLQPAVVDRVEQ